MFLPLILEGNMLVFNYMPICGWAKSCKMIMNSILVK